jgi:voltage-gated potassium channel
VVTLTTVGYGDVVPKTPTGRWAAVVIMVTGIAVLGLLAGSLASFLRLEHGPTSSGEGDGEGPDAGSAGATAESTLRALTAEVATLRSQVAALDVHLEELTTRSPGTRQPGDPPA